MQGKVKFYNKPKAFGFILQEDGSEIFFHISGIHSSSMDEQGRPIPDFLPWENDVVEYDIEEGKKGPEARNITLVQKASEMDGGDMDMA